VNSLFLYLLTALAEIFGCYLPYLWLKRGASVWVLVPAAISLGVFVWLLSLHAAPSGRVYAAYGGVYITTAIGWLWLVDKIKPSAWDVGGCTLALLGVAVIVLQPR
jgi:small multidrug resistance family-3 protein